MNNYICKFFFFIFSPHLCDIVFPHPLSPPLLQRGGWLLLTSLKEKGWGWGNFLFYKENKRTTVSIIHIVVIHRNLVRKFPFMVLWRKACIPSTAPNHHPSAVQISKFFSETLRFWAVALYLSTHRITKVTRLIRRIYRISTLVRAIIFSTK